ncbi:MAG TPA: vitamin B12 dependent-methionine synthase activation domain-containing protein [Paludibacteraceae bacterium]|nr:vitamin B12 dependent-methionine synthase activation domain-containing protein [Paludibacteraceae bacterium]
MPNKPTTPNNTGEFHLTDISLSEIVSFIDWRFFFHAWRLTGKYDGIETVCDCASCKTGWLQSFDEKDRPKAEEALKLFRDAREMLRQFQEDKTIKINAAYSINHAFAANDDIIIQTENQTIKIPTLRQQQPSSDGFCYCLADFLSEKDDYVGTFVTTVTGAEELAAIFEKGDDMYQSILVKTLSDRLAEASAEWLHYKIRKEYWGYTPDENLTMEDMLKTKYSGIRPAIGYPSLPDQSIIFELEPLLHFSRVGVKLTENGAMYPNASVCGLYFAHPLSKYFMIGKIDENQLADYARRRGKTTTEMRKWLAANI